MSPNPTPPFWVDTDVLERSQRGMLALDIAPGFWAALDAENRAGRVFSVEEVYRELDRHIESSRENNQQMGPLREWIQQRRASLFIQPGAAESAAMGRVSSFAIATYGPAHCRKFLDGADPWLIAAAMVSGGSVVTNEKPNQLPNPNRATGLIDSAIKIPNICHQFDVPVATLPQMMRSLGIQWR